MKKGKNKFEILNRLYVNFRRDGLYLITSIAFEYLFFKIFRKEDTFIFRGKKYRYFYHWYNTTWKNERAVEISIISNIVRANKTKRILEVGNVLLHYFDFPHDILDKYEIAPGVINQDIVDYRPNQKYDLIISISTLEHIGWDEKIKDPKKIPKALKNMIDCVVPGGKIFLTFPLGENPFLDDLFERRKMYLDKITILSRIENGWKEISQKKINWKKIRQYKSSQKKSFAKILVIGTINRLYENKKR